MADVIEWKRQDGTIKGFDIEMGVGAFNGTIVTADIPTDLSCIYHASFAPAPGTTVETTGMNAIRVVEAALGTTGTVACWQVSGTALTVERALAVQNQETVTTAATLRFTYMLVGKS